MARGGEWSGDWVLAMNYLESITTEGVLSKTRSRDSDIWISDCNQAGVIIPRLGKLQRQHHCDCDCTVLTMEEESQLFLLCSVRGYRLTTRKNINFRTRYLKLSHYFKGFHDSPNQYNLTRQHNSSVDILGSLRYSKVNINNLESLYLLCRW